MGQQEGFIKFAEIPQPKEGEYTLPSQLPAGRVAPGASGGAPFSAEEFAPPSDSPASVLAKLAALLPMAGGAIGGIAGGPVGAGIGGAAGGGFGELAQHATEIPGAVKDVLGNLVAQPEATLRGALGGVQSGTGGAALNGAVQGGLELGGGLAMNALGKGATALMRGYLKPSLAQASIKDARQIVQTALDEALPVSKAGEERASGLIADLNKQVNNVLANTKGKVDLGAVADRVRTFAKAKYFKPGVDSADYKAALDVADAIDNHASLQLPNGAKVTSVSAPVANDIKQAVRPPSRAYGQQGAAAETATRKVAGSEMRQAIEQLAPGVGPMNAREGRLIDAQDAIGRAAGREENKGLNPTAVPNLIAGAVGAEEGYRRDPASGLAMALATRAALSPAIATRAAIIASQLARTVPGMVPANAARIALALAQQQGSGNPGQ